MRAAMSQLNLLARGYHRILKLASTVADLVESEEIQSVHLADALQYSPKLWNLSGHNTDIAAMITKIVPQHFKLIML